jgi:hypothetical protein
MGNGSRAGNAGKDGRWDEEQAGKGGGFITSDMKPNAYLKGERIGKGGETGPEEWGEGACALGSGEPMAGVWHGSCCQESLVDMAWDLLQLFSACQKKCIDGLNHCAIVPVCLRWIRSHNRSQPSSTVPGTKPAPRNPVRVLRSC